MSSHRRVVRRVWFLLNRRRLEDALRQEMDAHRDMMADAARRFGNVLRLREDSRDVWGWAWLDDLVARPPLRAPCARRAPRVHRAWRSSRSRSPRARRRQSSASSTA